jgi:hypothetical protein
MKAKSKTAPKSPAKFDTFQGMVQKQLAAVQASKKANADKIAKAAVIKQAKIKSDQDMAAKNKMAARLRAKTEEKTQAANKRNAETVDYNKAKAGLRKDPNGNNKVFVAELGKPMTTTANQAKQAREKIAAYDKKYPTQKPTNKPTNNTTPKADTKTTSKPAVKTETKTDVKQKTNSYESANKGGAMDKLVKARNSAAKDSREYAAAQNQINAAMGSKVRHTAKKETSVSTLKPAEAKKETITASTPAKMKKKC